MAESWNRGTNRGPNSLFGSWYHCVKQSYIAAWICRVFQTATMSNIATGHPNVTSTSGGISNGGALSLMGCVRETTPSPHDHETFGFGDYSSRRSVETLPKEPKKRRFHPLRGLRRIFRRKSRSAADGRLQRKADDLHDREEITLSHPAGRPEEAARSRSASELLTDSSADDRRSTFLRRKGRTEESLGKLRGTSGQLSVSHDSVFPGEVPHTRPLSSLDTLATLQRQAVKTSDETVHKDYNINVHAPYNQPVSLRVLEQIKTAIENRNQLTSTESTHASHNHFSRGNWRERNYDERSRVPRAQQDVLDRVAATPKEELPELESVSLNHTAAHHRISVRPKNRRPPKRPTIPATNLSCSTITTVSESSDTLDSLEPIIPSNASTPIDIKSASITRKSSSRLSRTSDSIFEDQEAKLSKNLSSMTSLSPDSLDLSVTRLISDASETEEREKSRKMSNRASESSDLFDELDPKMSRKRGSTCRLSKSPDSLDNLFSKSHEDFDTLIDKDSMRPTLGRYQSSISVSTEGFDKLSDHAESRPTPRRLTGAISKSTEAFDKLEERDEPRAVPRRLLYTPAKLSDPVSKSSDSLETVETLLVGEDSIERRRNSFEIRPRRSLIVASKSTENFEALDKTQDLKKRCSASDVLLRATKRPEITDKVMSKSTENFESIRASLKDAAADKSRAELGKYNWRLPKRAALSSSSENLELGDKSNQRKPPKRVPSSTIVDIVSRESQFEERPIPMKKPPRLEKSSESSELGSTDTLDSDRRNKSSDSTETLDSLEKDFERERRDEDVTVELRHANSIWPSKMTDSEQESDAVEETKLSDKSYWRQTSDSKENIDIHQLLAITLVNQMDNGNNQRNSAPFPKRKVASTPTSPVVKQPDNKLLLNNLLTSKNDEELQNMLNGNISEVSTDTKSFKEKLIMFEKLGK